MKSEATTSSIDSLEVDLNQYWLILKRRWIPALGVFSSLLLLVIWFASLQKPVYQAQGKLLLKVDRIAKLTGVGTDLGEFSPLTIQNSPLKTESIVITSEPILKKTITQLQLQDKENELLQLNDLVTRLTVTTIPGADVLQIVFEDRNPETAANVINQLMLEYIKNNIDISQAQSAEAKKIISDQLPKTEAVLRQADVALRNFKEQNGITSLEDESRALVGSTSTLDADITKARADLADVSSRLVALQEKVGLSSQEAVAVSTLSQSSGVQQALKDLQEVKSQLATEQSRYEDQYATVVNLKQRESALKGLLENRVLEILGRSRDTSIGDLQIGETKQKLIQTFVATEIDRLGLANRINSLSDTRELYQQRSLILPQLEQKQRELQRQLVAAQANYDVLLKKQQEIQVVSQQSITGNARVLEVASPKSEPVTKKKILTLTLGFLLAAVAAIITLIWLEVCDRSVKTTKDARKLFSYPWLGVIPKYQQTGSHDKNAHNVLPVVSILNAPRSTIGAAYRSLQVNLKLLHPELALKTLVVTSALSGEGKSTISANLAATIAQHGRRVLLIDADFHHPQQHLIWQIPNTQGLCDVITKQVGVATVIHPVIEGLDVLTGGMNYHNLPAVIDSNAMRDFIGSVTQQYDLVIFDTSPFIAEPETLTLNPLTNGMILVVRLGVLDFDSAFIARELLQQSTQSVLGLVVNGGFPEIKVKSSQYYQQESSISANSSLSPDSSKLVTAKAEKSISKLN